MNTNLSCSLCNKSYSHQSALNQHLKIKHQVEKNVEYDFHVYKAKCLDCKSSFRYISELRNHLETKHNFNNGMEKFEFNNREEFQKWLDTIQSEENINYVKKGEDRRKSNVYYNCNRSAVNNYYKPLKKRVSKSQGSCKLNFLCTSQIIMKVVNEKSLKVTYYRSHYGHDKDVQHVRIPVTDKKSIANKLASGVSISRILDQTRDNIVEEEPKRIHLLTRKDILNIRVSFGVDNVKEDARSNDNDPESVDMWVEEQKMMGEENAVLFYKKQGSYCDILDLQDFCIILMNQSQQHLLKKFGSDIIYIDFTFGLKQDEFECTTMMVLDEHREWFPCATIFTNRKDTQVFKLFFTKIREKVGDIATETFMSGINSVFFDAWCEAMSPPQNQLYCAWHVDRAWQKNLHKIKIPGKKEEVYKILRHLQHFEDKNKFEEELDSVLSFLKSDSHTSAFGSYFEENYSHNFKLWALCYRKECDINSNMHIEAHKPKYSYLKGTKDNQLTEQINAIIKYMRDKTALRLLKNTKGKTISKRKRIREEETIIIDGIYDETDLCEETLPTTNTLLDDIELMKTECLKIVDKLSDLGKSEEVIDVNIISQCRQQLKEIQLLLNIDCGHQQSIDSSSPSKDVIHHDHEYL